MSEKFINTLNSSEEVLYKGIYFLKQKDLDYYTVTNNSTFYLLLTKSELKHALDNFNSVQEIRSKNLSEWFQF
jgi:hypothetical protein